MRTLNLIVILNKGADFSVLLRLPDDAGGWVDITDYTFESQMRETTSPDSPIAGTFNFEVVEPQSDADNKGKVRWFMTNEETEAIQASIASINGCPQKTPYLFDIKMTDTLGVITRIVQGKVLVSPEVTQEETP